MRQRTKTILAWAAFIVLNIVLFTEWLPDPAEWAVVIAYGGYLIGWVFRLPPSWRRKLKRKWNIVVRG